MTSTTTNRLPVALQPSSEPTLRIGDIARLAEKSARAVRLYEEMGLLGRVFRTEGGHRLYGNEVLLRIAWIDKLQTLGFSLTQIRSLLGEWTEAEHGPQAMTKAKEIFEEKLEDTRAQIRTLENLVADLEDSLSYLRTCEVCDPSTLLGTCSTCDAPHGANNEAPDLVAGFYVSAEKKDS